MKTLLTTALLFSISLVVHGNANAALDYNGHRYELTSISSGWAECQAEAVAKGGNLVTINDEAEQAWLTANFGSSRLWTGFTDEAQEGTWVWVSGEPVTYTNWNSGEPNNHLDNEDYAVLNYFSGHDKWNDWGPLQYDFPSTGIHGIIETAVPLPPAVLLFGPALLGLAAIGKKLKR